MYRNEKGVLCGYNLDEPELKDLSSEEQADVLEKLLAYLQLRVVRDSTPDYTEIALVSVKDKL